MTEKPCVVGIALLRGGLCDLQNSPFTTEGGKPSGGTQQGGGGEGSGA